MLYFCFELSNTSVSYRIYYHSLKQQLIPLYRSLPESYVYNSKVLLNMRKLQRKKTLNKVKVRFRQIETSEMNETLNRFALVVYGQCVHKLCLA